jgi:alpha-L-fucosidase
MVTSLRILTTLLIRFYTQRTYNGTTIVVALIHFNMATYARDGDPGCDSTNWNQRAPNATGPTSNPETFRPALLNTTQWFDSINALGAKIAVLTAKHGCGFLLWPTNATLPPVLSEEKDVRPFASSTSRMTKQQTTRRPPSPYGYHTNYDLLQDFVNSAEASGVGYGFYYSIMKNFFLCRSFEGTNSCAQTVLNGQHNVTDEEYHDIVNVHLTELWTAYGDLAEVWIDSKLEGFGALMDELQPLAGGTPSNPRQWCGTESGFPSKNVGPGPIWQTGTGFFGDPSSPNWVDKFCDPQLFRDHVWFYEPNRRVRSLDEMIPIYHDIVGRGMIMELAFAINRDGLLEKSHEAVYKQLGKWVENCYGTPVLSKQNTIGERRIKLRLPSGSSGFRSFDRIVLREDVAIGQRIRNYTIDLVYDNDSDNTGPEEVIATLVSNGTSVGRKRIHLLGEQHDDDCNFTEPMYNTERNWSVVLTITEEIGPPHLAMFGLYEPCYPESSAQ